MIDRLIHADWPAPVNVVAGTTTRAAAEDVLPPGTRFLNQVHGAAVVTSESLRDANEPLDADAVTGSVSGDVCAVRTADCLPVLFCSIEGDSIAAAHAGWRGLAAGILENTVAAMDYPAGSLIAWFGPAISQANFEVGAEVREAFITHDAAAASCFEQNARDRWQADLYGLARQRLYKCGVEAIYGGGWCTYADEDWFFSYRRAADSDRMVSFVALK
ncbi:MAG: peptidoglycan editing factor PgeF [Gammaproteobacteria bacterium]|nr:peptidoglycan editing factor PgeF [Gammaproteobacteria bacterium]